MVAGTRYVVVESADGLRLTYGKLATAAVGEGDQMQQGQRVVAVGFKAEAVLVLITKVIDDPPDAQCRIALAGDFSRKLTDALFRTRACTGLGTRVPVQSVAGTLTTRTSVAGPAT